MNNKAGTKRLEFFQKRQENNMKINGKKIM